LFFEEKATTIENLFKFINIKIAILVAIVDFEGEA